MTEYQATQLYLPILLSGLIREDAGYVMGTFPMVWRQDEAAFGGYRTRDMALAYINALSAEDVGTVGAV